MKRILAIALAALMAISAVGCTSNMAGSAPANNPSTPAGGALKTGYAVISSVAGSTDAGEKDGVAQTESVFVAVLVDDKGVITDCKLDSVKTQINFDKAGMIVTPPDTKVPSKNEIGADYGMKKASSIGKEWNEQAAAFAKYAVGKTAAQITGIAVSEKGATTDAELAASVTLSIGSFQKAVSDAVANAQAVGAMSGDKLGVATTTTIEKSANVGEKDGQAQAYSYYTVATFGAGGKITSCVLDASQCNVDFDKTGKITSDIKAEMPTKNQLGDKYGMKKASSIKMEWNTQAENFAKFVVGKTVAEVKGIAIDEKEGAPVELATSVTIGVADFQTGLEKAMANAG